MRRSEFTVANEANACLSPFFFSLPPFSRVCVCSSWGEARRRGDLLLWGSNAAGQVLFLKRFGGGCDCSNAGEVWQQGLHHGQLSCRAMKREKKRSTTAQGLLLSVIPALGEGGSRGLALLQGSTFFVLLWCNGANRREKEWRGVE